MCRDEPSNERRKDSQREKLQIARMTYFFTNGCPRWLPGFLISFTKTGDVHKFIRFLSYTKNGLLSLNTLSIFLCKYLVEYTSLLPKLIILCTSRIVRLDCDCDVDILAVDGNRDLVVVELKVSKGYDRAIGQLLRYMAWIERNLAEPGQKVKGMIIARRISDDLSLATSNVRDVQLFEYQLSISLDRIDV